MRTQRRIGKDTRPNGRVAHHGIVHLAQHGAGGIAIDGTGRTLHRTVRRARATCISHASRTHLARDAALDTRLDTGMVVCATTATG